MNKSDFMAHWDKIRRHYPNRFNGVHNDEIAELCEDYYDALKDFSDGAVFLSIKNHLESEKSRYFPGIGQLINLCRGQAGVSKKSGSRFPPLAPPNNPTDEDKRLYELEVQEKDRWVSLRVKELMLGVVGIPYGEPERHTPLSREDAVREALKTWDVVKYDLLDAGPCPPDVKGQIDAFMKGGRSGTKAENSESGDRGVQRVQAEGPTETGLAEPDWSFEGPSCVPDWEQPVAEETAEYVGGIPF